MPTKIAIIGGGIVGSTAAFYLHQQPGVEIIMFDDGTGQATKAAAGIISPWLSKRRNQQWYRLARDGAGLFHELAIDAHLTGTSFARTGTIITRDDSDDLDALEQLAYERRDSAPTMGEIYRLNEASIKALLPFVHHSAPGILITGGARIDGQLFCAQLQQAANVIPRPGRVSFNEKGDLVANGQIEKFDLVIAAVGAWLPELLNPLGLTTAVRPQKGQLLELKTPVYQTTQPQPVLMPEGERDFIPTTPGQLIVGATHENDQGFDLTPSVEVENDLLASANRVTQTLTTQDITGIRVGTRAYTQDFAPFFGTLVGHESILVASGLGSSGLTTGPLIGQLLAQMAIGQTVATERYTKATSQYIS
ncbi:NAD(P)/FAD-dependent oxidoreductase [Furfurilactobacillus siliginis]|uniref:Glycine D-amino acid oxidase n=1 Tax=Furfurilactobacillus siliginis TaxID=348151 RepID=A0A0R2L5G0_9LACO|nr:FAD-dependent oxidoreductase [Furfurilactobacillus siliginis]KRN96959.1 glycine D-amino acid oxidase [Furfurilactobacillus siliginis]GEK27718.1 oxidoreductase [Furfurilactobacillus siliginis]